ncbi:DUF1194 domain-containing protein [Roseovarius sp. 2305UL8-3]|uniref:DUF1194 domain-containing protein n=1 Tax=Roseovarius conchicola TaxID=3121636 RepID=UPI0035294808
MTPLILKVMILWLMMSALPAAAQTCRQALALGLDVSLSVNPIDFTLQREGLARALLDDEVVVALLGSGQDRLELAVFEWSGQFDQKLLVDWTIIDSRQTLRRIATTLRESQPSMRSGRTGLGAAMLYARDMFATREHCTNWTLDISGDGANNNGILPELVRAQMDEAGIVVNALVIGTNEPNVAFGEVHVGQLARYFQERVIVGPSSFVETIIGFDNYAEAMKRKLLRELMPSFVRRDPAPRAVRLLAARAN